MANEIMATFETAITPHSELKLQNRKLLQHTKAIEKLMTATKRNMFEISARLLVIRNEELFIDDGFKDVFDYAEKMFNYKKNMVYKLTTAAEKFIEASPEGKGYVSILTHENADYTVSQLIELNSLEPTTAVELDKKEIISPDMTTKEIREVVKSYKNGEIDDNGEWIGGEDETDESEKGDKVDSNIEKIIATVTKNLDKLLKDERLDETTADKIKEFQAFIEQVTVYEVN